MRKKLLKRDAAIAALIGLFAFFMCDTMLQALPLWLFVTMVAWVLIVGTDPAFDMLKEDRHVDADGQ